MDCIALFRDTDSDSEGGHHYSGNSDASDGDEWLRPTGGDRTDKAPVKLSRKQRRKLQKESSFPAKEKAASLKKQTGGDTGSTKGKVALDALRKPTAGASVLSSAVSSVAGGLPAPLLFLRQRSLSSSNLAGGLKDEFPGRTASENRRERTTLVATAAGGLSPTSAKPPALPLRQKSAATDTPLITAMKASRLGDGPRSFRLGPMIGEVPAMPQLSAVDRSFSAPDGRRGVATSRTLSMIDTALDASVVSNAVVSSPDATPPASDVPWQPEPPLIPLSRVMGADTPLDAIPNVFDGVVEKCPMLAQEVERGNVEYKWQLVDPTEERIMHLVTQMRWRLRESRNRKVSTAHGEAVYRVGVEDNGNPKGLTDEFMYKSLCTIKRMADAVNADMFIVEMKTGVVPGSRVAMVVVKERLTAPKGHTEARIAAIGDVDSGKTTLIGVLSTGTLDNGKGIKRLEVFRHVHEVAHGRTSSITQQVIGFDPVGSVTNYAGADIRQRTVAEVVNAASKVITLVDLAGHEKYLRTTVFGLTSQAPDYAMLIVSAVSGVQRMTREHFALAMALRLPTFICVTKSDVASPKQVQQVLVTLKNIISSPGVDKESLVVSSIDDVHVACEGVRNLTTVPLIVTSNVTGAGIDILRRFLFHLPTNPEWDHRKSQRAEFRITESFKVSGVGTVVAGTVYRGVIRIGSMLMLGPDGFGGFRPVVVRSIHNHHIPVSEVSAGQEATFCLRMLDGDKLKRNAIRKGMVLLGSSEEKDSPCAVLQLEADIILLDHNASSHTPIKVGYEVIVHGDAIRQAAKVVAMSGTVIYPGDRARVTLSFQYHPEYITKGTLILFRIGASSGVGRVLRTSHPCKPQPFPSPSIADLPAHGGPTGDVPHIPHAYSVPIMIRSAMSTPAVTSPGSDDTFTPIAAPSVPSTKLRKTVGAQSSGVGLDLGV